MNHGILPKNRKKIIAAAVIFTAAPNQWFPYQKTSTISTKYYNRFKVYFKRFLKFSLKIFKLFFVCPLLF